MQKSGFFTLKLVHLPFSKSAHSVFRTKDEEIQQREIDISCLRGQVNRDDNDDSDDDTLEDDNDDDDQILLEDLEIN